MPSFKLPESEANDMRRFYEDELDKTLQRLQHIKNVLEQLGGSGHSIDIKVKTNKVDSIAPIAAGKTGPKRKNRKRPGRKSLWEKVIMGRFEDLKRPMTYEELTDEIMSFSNLPANKRLSTKQAIMNVAFRLRTRDKMIDTFSIGQREKYLAPSTWFESKGKMQKDYLNRIQKDQTPASAPAAVSTKPVAKATPPVKAAPAKRGRKPKAAAESAKKTAVVRKKRTTKATAKRKPAAKKATPTSNPS